MTRSSGTKAPSTMKSLVPVPRMPRTFQMSTTSTSAAGTNRNFCTRSPSGSGSHARAANHDACREPELKRWRPVTRYPPGAGTASAVGMDVLATTQRGVSVQISRATSGAMRAA